MADNSQGTRDAGIKRYIRRIRAWISRPKIIFQDRLIRVDDHSYCDNPIFIIGIHRSGTSLLRRVINSHPNIACPAESFFMQHYVAMLGDQLVQDGYVGFGNDREMMRVDLARKASSLHEANRLANGKTRWADKTPQYTAILPGLLNLFGPKTSFVMIYRHPFDVMESIKQRRWDLAGKGQFDFNATLNHVREQYDKQLAFEAKHSEKCVRVSYEDLTETPEPTLRKLMAGIGEDFDPKQLVHHHGNHGFGTEDPIARGLTGFQPSLGNWWTWDDETYSAACASLGEICTQLGYSTVRNELRVDTIPEEVA